MSELKFSLYFGSQVTVLLCINKFLWIVHFIFIVKNSQQILGKYNHLLCNTRRNCTNAVSYIADFKFLLIKLHFGNHNTKIIFCILVDTNNDSQSHTVSSLGCG